MTVKVRLDDRRLVALPAALERLADQICNKAAKNIETRAKIKIQSPPKTGRIYRHGKVEHQASAPGEAPATDTGNLVNSIASDRVRPMLHEVTVGAEYSSCLEYGTSRMAPRPFFRPSFDEERDGFKREVDKLIGLARERVR